MTAYAYPPKRTGRSKTTESSSSQSNHNQNLSNQQIIQEMNEYGAQEFTSDTIDLMSLMLLDGEQLSNNSMATMSPTKDLNGGLRMASALMDGVQSYQDSPAQSTNGRSLDALMDVSGSMMISANPFVGTLDMLLPESLKMSNLVDGSTSAVSCLAESFVTNESEGMEKFMENAKGGEYSWFMKEAVEAGEFWAR